MNKEYYRCTSLSSIVIPDNITSIGDSAFEGSGLESITVGEGLTLIGERAFSKCENLFSFNIPNNLTSISDYTFEGCTSLSSIVIPDNITSIGDSAFEGSGLESLTIGKGVTSIGDRAVENSKPISVYISDLSAWCKISFPASDIASGGKLYLNNEQVTTLTIPDDVTEISSNTFYGFSGIAHVVIHENVTSIGDYAFNFVDSEDTLESLVIKGAPCIGERVFGGMNTCYCYSTIPPTLLNNSFDFGTTIKPLYVPKGCKEVYENSQWGYDFAVIREME